MRKILFLLLTSSFASAQTPAPTNNQYGTRTPFLVPPTTATKVDVTGGLQVNSTTSPFTPPRATTTQINAMSNVVEGSQAFDNVLHIPKYYNGSNWVGFGTLLTADELAAIQNANAPNAGNPFATINDIDGVVLSVTGTTVNNTDPVNPVVNVPTMQQTATAGNEITSDVIFGDLAGGDYTTISGTDLQMYASATSSNVEIAPELGFKSASADTDNSLNHLGLDLNGNTATGQKVTFQNTAQTTAGVSYDVIDRAAGTYHVATTEDLTGFGTGTVTSVTGTNGVTVASGTSTPVIGLGNITPTKVNGITLSGSSTPALAVTGTASVSGANTGDQDLSALELTSNKQNSLAADGTGNKYITVDAVRKLSAFANLEIYPTQTGSSAPTLIIVNNPTAAVITSSYIGIGDYTINSDLPIFANCYPNTNTSGIELHWIVDKDLAFIHGWFCWRIDDYTMGLRSTFDSFNFVLSDDFFDGGQLVVIKLKL